MDKVRFRINSTEVEVAKGSTILDAARQYNIHIPTLCYYPDLGIKSDCRICVVEIEGQKGLVTSCSTLVREGITVFTNSPRVLNARKTIVELILANHDANCTACPKNLNCELQSLAKKLGIEHNRYESVLKLKPIDTGNAALVRNPNRCIKCARCIDVCKNIQGVGVLEMMGRSHDMSIHPAFHQPLSDAFCTFCGQCASVCPVGAITEKDDTDRVWKALHDDEMTVICQVAPSIRVSLGEEIQLPVGSIVTGKIVSCLKLMGFNHVFDTDFTADLTIMEEGSELIERLTHGGVLPMMTSCCPGWINFAETEFPEILPHLSSCKSPQQMFGALAKTYFADKVKLDPSKLFVVSIMPCTAKKYEAKRPEMRINGEDPDVDAVLTTRELGKMIRQMGIDFSNLEEADFDHPFGITSGAGAIFGASGGVMEAALRTVAEIVNQSPLDDIDFLDVRGSEGIKEVTVELGGKPLHFAVSNNLKNARKLAEEVKNGTSKYQFIEIMCCPGGCIGGGGQPYGTIAKTRDHRIQATYQVDQQMAIR
ncbi:MAG: NADH-dependent [FeFe] hydrogenase, group A6, partial [Candidatus Izemoplasmatales bacterium]|nr:NADH-dependent [FeFe] hydrogenase, group A6 [Candidatus Izemoplasmatales bacterium]